MKAVKVIDSFIHSSILDVHKLAFDFHPCPWMFVHSLNWLRSFLVGLSKLKHTTKAGPWKITGLHKSHGEIFYNQTGYRA